MKRYTLTLAFILLAGCGSEQKDYAASAACQNLGFKAGTPEYADCYKKEHSRNVMEQQRREFEKMKQNERDIRMRQY